MDSVQIIGVDERDSAWEQARPRFRVYLHGSSETSTEGWTDTYDVTGADVLQVIDWAQRQAGGSLTFAVALVHDDPAEAFINGEGRGLVWLVGMDGNDAPMDEYEAQVQRRTLACRAAPVGVPHTAGCLPGSRAECRGEVEPAWTVHPLTISATV